MNSEQKLREATRPSIEELWDLFLKNSDMRIYRKIQDRMEQKHEEDFL